MLTKLLSEEVRKLVEILKFLLLFLYLSKKLLFYPSYFLILSAVKVRKKNFFEFAHNVFDFELLLIVEGKKIRSARKIFDFEFLFMLGRKNFNTAHKIFRFQLLFILGTKKFKFTRKIFKVESLLRLGRKN